MLRVHRAALKSFSAWPRARLSPHALRSQQRLSNADPAHSPRPSLLPRAGSRLSLPSRERFEAATEGEKRWETGGWEDQEFTVPKECVTARAARDCTKASHLLTRAPCLLGFLLVPRDLLSSPLRPRALSTVETHLLPAALLVGGTLCLALEAAKTHRRFYFSFYLNTHL